MFLRRCTLLLLICLIASDAASAARKTKRPVKPVKQTNPRTNVTPSPPAVASSGSSTPASTSSTTTTEGSGDQEVATVGSAALAGGGELPKPLVTPIEAQPEAKTDKAPALEEECDPDMIGFEIITGWVQFSNQMRFCTFATQLNKKVCQSRIEMDLQNPNKICQNKHSYGVLHKEWKISPPSFQKCHKTMRSFTQPKACATAGIIETWLHFMATCYFHFCFSSKNLNFERQHNGPATGLFMFNEMHPDIWAN